MSKFPAAYAYATRNGYTGSFDAYVELQYAVYCKGCKRCDIEPTTKAEWIEAQSK